jgi:Matrixin
MRDALQLFLFFIITFNASAFTLNNSAALVFNHDEVKVNVANITCSNIGIDLIELKSIVADALNQYWNKSPTSRLKLRTGSIMSVAAEYGTDLICNASTSCTPNPALAVASDILITCNTNASNFSSSSILAVTVPNNTTDKTILGSLIMINDRAGNQFVNKSRDEKMAIIAHELGHAFGLGHSPVTDSLMYYSTVNMRTNLGQDDIDGITYLYPKQQPVACGSISLNNNPNTWLGLFIGFGLISLFSKFQFRYLKLRPRF